MFKVFSIARSWCLRKRKSKLRKMIRGYNNLNRSGELGLVARIKEQLTETPISACSSMPDLTHLAVNEQGFELALRQHLLIRQVAVKLGAQLLIAASNPGRGYSFGIPCAWRLVLRENGISVNETQSKLLWCSHVFIHWLNGLRVFALLTHAFLRRSGTLNKRPLRRYAYFDSLTVGNLPINNSSLPNDDQYDIVNWYLQWPGTDPTVDEVLHSVRNVDPVQLSKCRVSFIQTPHLVLTRRSEIFRFLMNGTKHICKSFFCLLLGNWKYGLGLGEIIRAEVMNICEADNLAKDYLFHNSNWIYRPLWTYVAEARGARVLFYFYSTNCEKFKTNGVTPTIPFGWRAMSWSHYLVWDNFQSNFVRKCIGDKSIVQEVGAINFHAASPLTGDFPENAVAIFDVQPFRSSIYKALGLDFEYYVPTNTNRFLEDIYSAGALTNTALVLKRKRHIGKRLHPQYRKLTDSMTGLNCWHEVDPDVSALELIKRCKAVVSSPYTSTALLGKMLGKPSVYYDPAGVCDRDDPAAHGMEILLSLQELQQWMAKLGLSTTTNSEYQ